MQLLENKLALAGLLILIIAVGFLAFFYGQIRQTIVDSLFTGLGTSAGSAVYTIDGQDFRLFAGTAYKYGVKLTVEGTPVVGDMNGDGVADESVLLRKKDDTGASYYVATALKEDGGYAGSNGVALGYGLISGKLSYTDGGSLTVEYGVQQSPDSAAPISGTSEFVYRDKKLQAASAKSSETMNAYYQTKLGETTPLGGKLLITPNKVLQDSRCPVGATCIQKGGVTIEAELSENGEAKTVTLSTDKALTVLDGTKELALVGVLPERGSEDTISNGEYTFTVSLTGITQ